MRRGSGNQYVAGFSGGKMAGNRSASVPGTELRKEIVLICHKVLQASGDRNVFWSVWEIGNIPEKAHNLGVRPKPVLWEDVMNYEAGEPFEPESGFYWRSGKNHGY